MTVAKSCLTCGWWMSTQGGGGRYVGVIYSLGLLVLTWAIHDIVVCIDV